MLSLSFQNLTIALCLALQVTATVFVPCPCTCVDTPMVEESRETGFASLAGMLDTSSSSCLLCESRPETQHPMRPASVERHERLSSVVVQPTVLVNANARPVSFTDCYTDTLPSSYAHELQVFLE